MGIYLHLIDERAPGGFEIICDAYNSPVYRRLRIMRGENMAAIARRVCDGFRPATLDVIRICAHGSPALSDIQFGIRLNLKNALQFAVLRNRWRVTYTTDSHGIRYRAVVPRVEMHVCGAAAGPSRVCQSLANALRAPVFAGRGDQEAGTNFAMEGRLVRFDPWLERPQLYNIEVT